MQIENAETWHHPRQIALHSALSVRTWVRYIWGTGTKVDMNIRNLAGLIKGFFPEYP